jgi:hypothetical protein
MYVDGYYSYDNFMDAVTRSLQAVEAALRERFDAGTRPAFAQLIDRAKTEGIVTDDVQEILHLGRRFRNDQIHATSLPALNPAISASMVGASHRLVAEIFDARPAPPRGG